MQENIAAYLGWYYLVVVGGFLVFVSWLGAGRFGRIRLGPPDSRPRYRYLTWFAMLFTAGMGIGLVFWAVAEPLSHLADPPTAEPGGTAVRAEAMRFTFFHRGLHAWAIYIVVGLSLACFAYRHRLPLSIRSALYPLLGKRVHGRAGDAVGTFAVFGTMSGVATSLGFGVLQVNAGLASLDLVPQSSSVQLLLIAGITLAAIGSFPRLSRSCGSRSSGTPLSRWTRRPTATCRPRRRRSPRPRCSACSGNCRSLSSRPCSPSCSWRCTS